MPGKLVLVATPIEEMGELKAQTKDILLKACENSDANIIAVEDPKPARRRWLHWGLPRTTIEHFYYLNEHGQKESTSSLIEELRKGKNIFLLSDGGLPAFCDPGRALVYRCHEHNISVEATSFDNSLLLAIALSGFTEGPFSFLGFPPKEKEERLSFFRNLVQKKEVVSFMDTPYRLDRCLEEVSSAFKSKERKVLVAMDLGRETYELLWCSSSQLMSRSLGKREFVCVIAGQELG